MNRPKIAGLAGSFAGIMVSLLVFSGIAGAQMRFAQPGQLPPIDQKAQAAIIDSIGAAMSKSYVFADRAARMDSLVKAKLASGAYRDLIDPADFTMRLNEDMLAVYRDKHLGIRALPPEKPGAEKAPAENPQGDKERNEQLRRVNYGFKKIEILPGNIGYLELTRFAAVDVAGETAVGAMSLLANADALIIDLRQNGGGDASMIQLLTGYFLEEQKHLVSWYRRETNETQQSWSQAYGPGKRMLETPLFILTSNFTGSAAEEFTYDLKNLGRATVIGETTGGAAHTVSFHIFDFVSFRVGLQLPSGRSISPITNTNWEGTGVVPDITAPADQALATAQIEVLKKLRESAADEQAKYSLEWAQAALEGQLHPVVITANDLKAYIGTYGPRKIFREGNVLMYQREGRPKSQLVSMGKDLFGLEGLEYFRLKFMRDSNGRIDGVIGMYDNGQQDRSARTK